jgi:DNA-binding NarL/FixJ family response regulator
VNFGALVFWWQSLYFDFSEWAQILNLLSEGYSCRGMADKLHISKTTVITHKNNLGIKLKAKNSCQLILKAVLQGYLNLKNPHK